MTVINTAKKIMIPAGVVLCVGSLMTGCCTKKSESEKMHTTSQPAMQSGSMSSEKPSTGISEASGATTEGMQETVIPLHQETLRVGKQNVDSGQVHLRKVIITEKSSQPVELRRESLEIVREPAGASASTTTNTTRLFEGQDIVINLKEEQPVLEKQVVQSGSIVAKKSTTVEQRTISGDVRKEDVQVDRTGGSGKVTFQGGTINEASGAQQQKQQEQPQPQPQEPVQQPSNPQP